MFACTNADDINDAEKRNSNWVWFVDESGNGKWIKCKGGGSKELTGEITFFYDNGKIDQKAHVFEGKYVDTSFNYNPDGRLFSLLIYEEDSNHMVYLIDGPYELYFGNMELKESGEIKNGKKHGTVTSYSEYGKLIELRNYNEGIFDGKQSYFYENGGKKRISNYKNGIRHGAYNSWYEDGTTDTEQFYEEGKWEGEQRWFYPNGNPEYVSNYKAGVREGPLSKYYENGRLEFVNNYVNGVRQGECIGYSADGREKTIYLYQDGKIILEAKQ